ncbi:hypothetical protein GW916_03130 [bacterium]|nr:hypothetical protein [bacterium]
MKKSSDKDLLSVFNQLRNKELYRLVNRAPQSRSEVLAGVGFLSLLKEERSLERYSKNFASQIRAHGLSSLVDLISSSLNGSDTSLSYFELFESDRRSDLDFEKWSLYFHIGQIHLQKRSFELAKIFFLKSEEVGDSLDLSLLAWRSKFNKLICDLYLGDSFFQTQLDLLHESLWNLEFEARFYCFELLLWMEIYLCNYDKAYSLCEKMEAIAHSNQQKETLRLIYVAQYFLFLLGVCEEPISKAPAGDSLTDELRRVRSYATTSERRLMALSEEWALTINPVEIYFLIAGLYHVLMDLNKAAKLISIHSHFSHFLLKRSPLLPAANLNRYLYLAHSSLNHFYEAVQYREEALKGYRALVVSGRESSWMKNILPEMKKKMVLDRSAKTLVMEGRKIDLKNRDLSFKTLVCFFRNPKGIKISDLYFSLYKEKYDVKVHSSKISALLRGIRTLCGEENLLERRGDGIYLSNQYIPVFHSKRGPENKSHARKKQILKLFCGKKELTISQIQRLVEFPRRTIQKDLQELVSEGALLQKAQGRTTSYRLS